jgi:hypothetical protein
MKIMRQEVAVSKLVTGYRRRLRTLAPRGLHTEWDVVFGDDEFPPSQEEAIETLTQDYADWMGALEPAELEAVWEDQEGSPVQVIGEMKKRGKKVA